MQFNTHDKLVGLHAFLSPSNYHWVNYSDEKLLDTFKNRLAVEKGTQDHAFAKICIDRKQKLPNKKSTLNMFVNDAIGYRMRSEQVLYYSDNCFGTADAIAFKKNKLRIYDLKTGVTKASMLQLMVYAALFCLEYNVDPETIDIELRIYQSNEVLVDIPSGEEIKNLMETIERFDRLLEQYEVGDEDA